MESEIIESAMNDLFLYEAKRQEDWVLDICRNNVVPVIKGEITRGKLKWRGLRIIVDNYKKETRLEQRGVLVGKPLLDFNPSILY